MVYAEFQKTGDFKSQQLEMMYKQIIYHSKGIDESYPKMYFLSNLSYYVKSFGHFCQNFGIFYNAHSPNMVCHVAQEANFEKNFFLILHLILRKVTKFLMGKLCTSKVVSRKHTPSAFRVKILLTWNCRHTTSWAKVGPMQAKYKFSYLPGFVWAKLSKNL